MKNFRTQVFKRAYEIAKQTGKAFAVCLSKAWQLYQLAKQMKNAVITFYYEKKDGTLRKAKGTLQVEDAREEKQDARSRKPSAGVFTYFDTEANGFRAFKVENFIKTI